MLVLAVKGCSTSAPVPWMVTLSKVTRSAVSVIGPAAEAPPITLPAPEVVIPSAPLAPVPLSVSAATPVDSTLPPALRTMP